MRVEQFKVANQFRITDLYTNVLQSYNSKVVEITENPGCVQTIILGRDWDYSTTTSKYVYMFLEEYSKIRFIGVNNKRKYINDLLEDYKKDYKEFIDKHNFIIIYNEDMV